MAILIPKKYFLSIATYLEPKIQLRPDVTFANYFHYSKTANVLYKNDRFEEVGAWPKILEKEPNSTIFYLIFDTHDSPGFVFIWKCKSYSHQLLVCSSFLLIFEVSKNGTD